MPNNNRLPLYAEHSPFRVLNTFKEYMQMHRQRPIMWSLSEVRDYTLATMRDNLRPIDYSSYHHAHIGWHTKDNRLLRRQFGETLAKAFDNDDVDSALHAVNTGYRTLRRHSNTNFADLFNRKFSDTYECCDDCGHIDASDRGEMVYEGDYWVCQSCVDDNYRWSDRRDTYITTDDWYDEDSDDDEDEDDEDRIIGDYHDSKGVVGHIPSKYDAYKSPDKPHRPVLLGMELEVEVSNDYTSGDKARELYDAIKYINVNGETHQYCFIERDGSLNHGFEIVTGYTGLDVHAKQLQFFKTPWRGVRSHDTRTCGLHVHIDKAGMSLFHACKMVFFINDSNNQKLIKDIARRANADYAQIKNKKASYQWLKRAKSTGNPLNYLNEERREALNFQNDNTIEFRLFKGTLRYETIMACLEFTYATWFFCRETGVTELTTANFIDFIGKPQNREHTKFLRSYLKEKGYVLPRLALVKPNPRSADYQPQPVEQLVA